MTRAEGKLQKCNNSKS